MSSYVNNKYRIKRSASQQEAMLKLVNAKVFDQYKDILMISAMIGFANQTKRQIDKEASDGVLMQFFSPRDYDVMDLIAYADRKEQSIINDDAKYDIFSSYANAGFPILLNKLEIDDVDEIDADSARKILMKYYKNDPYFYYFMLTLPLQKYIQRRKHRW